MKLFKSRNGVASKAWIKWLTHWNDNGKMIKELDNGKNGKNDKGIGQWKNDKGIGQWENDKGSH